MLVKVEGHEFTTLKAAAKHYNRSYTHVSLINKKDKEEFYQEDEISVEDAREELYRRFCRLTGDDDGPSGIDWSTGEKIKTI